MGTQGAEIDSEICDLLEYATMHVAKPRELVHWDTDNDVWCSPDLVITACLVVIACAEILSLFLPAPSPSLRVFCSPRGGSSRLRSAILFGAQHALQPLYVVTSGDFACLLRSLCVPSILVSYTTQWVQNADNVNKHGPVVPSSPLREECVRRGPVCVVDMSCLPGRACSFCQAQFYTLA